MGDAVQTLKAGILEIADIFALNKADQEGATQMLRALRGMLHMGPANAWQAPIVETQAHEAIGILPLWEALLQHRAYLESTGELLRRRAVQLRAEILDLVERGLRTDILRALLASTQFGDLLAEVLTRRRDPDSAAHAVLAAIEASPEQIRDA
jgi:LAO/AO transport system kinase